MIKGGQGRSAEDLTRAAWALTIYAAAATVAGALAVIFG